MESIIKISITIMFLMTIFSCNNNDKNIEETNDKNIAETNIVTKKSIINPPLPNLNIKYTSFTVNTAKDTVLIHKTGSKINIPKNAFIDSLGNIINGKVNIQYREFSNAFDIYLAGIPMNVSINDTIGVLETAGMIEFNATYKNMTLRPNPVNKISVKLNSYNDDEKFNNYYLDTSTGEWTDLGPNELIKTTYKEEINNLPKIPNRPAVATVNSFELIKEGGTLPSKKQLKNDVHMVYDIGCPGIEEYENVLFELINGKRLVNTREESFHCICIKDLKNGQFEITLNWKYPEYEEQLVKNKKQAGKVIELRKVICYPTFREGVDYNNAIKKYQKKYASLIDKRNKMKKKLEKEWENYFNIKKMYADAGMLNFFYKEEIKSLKGNSKFKIFRTLALDNFGFINCDYPSVYPRGANLIPKFVNKKGKEISLENIVLIEKGRNLLFRYPNRILFNPMKENILWGITNNGSVAYFKSNDFKTINSTTGDYIFKMTVHNQELKSYQDITNLLFK